MSTHRHRNDPGRGRRGWRFSPRNQCLQPQSWSAAILAELLKAAWLKPKKLNSHGQTRPSVSVWLFPGLDFLMATGLPNYMGTPARGRPRKEDRGAVPSAESPEEL